MATLLSDVLTRLAYRVGEDSSPTDTDEKARRVSFVVEGYRKAILSGYWDWTEASTTLDSQADVGTYTTTDGFPTDYRDAIELRVDGNLYTHIPQSKIFGLYDATAAVFNYDNLVSEKHWYLFGGDLVIYPAPTAAGTDNISLKYYKYPTMPTVDASTFDMPDIFTPCLDAYAYGKVKLLSGLRGDASDGFNEFDEIVAQMKMEANKHKFWGKSSRPVHPSYLVE